MADEGKQNQLKMTESGRKQLEVINAGASFVCPACWEAHETESALVEHRKTHKTHDFPEKLYFFERADGKLIVYNARHAVVFARHMKEYLGTIETDDVSILSKTAAEIRAMNLPREGVKDMRKTVVIKGVEYPMNVLGSLGSL